MTHRAGIAIASRGLSSPQIAQHFCTIPTVSLQRISPDQSVRWLPCRQPGTFESTKFSSAYAAVGVHVLTHVWRVLGTLLCATKFRTGMAVL
eukprot:SAG31_NODE_47_length_30979_cov_41.708841_14_plen_92_part_00